jgi:hypothetical protein
MSGDGLQSGEFGKEDQIWLLLMGNDKVQVHG